MNFSKLVVLGTICTVLVAATHLQADEAKSKTPAELLTEMENSLQLNPEDESPQGVRKALLAALSQIVALADQVIAHADSSTEQKKEANRFKISALYQGANVGELAYINRLSKYAEQLQKTQPKSDVASLAAFLTIKAKYSGPAGLTHDALPSIKKYLKSFPGDDGGIALLQEVGMAAEMTDEVKHARKAFGLIVKHFPQHPVADQTRGTLRRLELIGKPMKVSGTTLDGKPFNVASLKGKVVLIDFWATWCGPCLAEMPHLRETYEKYHEKGFEIVGIPLDEDKDELVDFLQDAEMPWRHVYPTDPAKRGFEHPIARYYGISGIPAMMLIDKAGNVAHLSVRGPFLEELVASLLAKPTAKVSSTTDDAVK